MSRISTTSPRTTRGTRSAAFSNTRRISDTKDVPDPYFGGAQASTTRSI